ncbi:MAG: hypothetical protein IJE25_07450 [Clostridia bacterium]|nr:hypothetical protein [Clostridia bacterium]
MATTNCYDRLYENMKNRLTVVESDSEYTLGEYMLKKAEHKKTQAMLPVSERSFATKGERALAIVSSFVNDKLTIKKPPVKDKTIKAFPFRASASAFLSALVACSFMLCFGLIGAKMLSSAAWGEDKAPSTVVAEIPLEEVDIETTYFC